MIALQSMLILTLLLLAVLSQLDCGNATFFSIPVYLLKRVQSMMNLALSEQTLLAKDHGLNQIQTDYPCVQMSAWDSSLLYKMARLRGLTASSLCFISISVCCSRL